MNKTKERQIRKEITTIIVSAIEEICEKVKKDETLIAHLEDIESETRLADINIKIESGFEEYNFSPLIAEEYHLTVEEIIEKRVQEVISNCF